MLTFQQSASSFFVDEEIAYEPCGSGPHVFAQLEKHHGNTRDLKRRVSEATGVPLKLIRHAGLKDREATSTQWLSWPVANQKNPLTDGPHFKCLILTQHTNRLAIGHVKCNHFRLRLNGPGKRVTRVVSFPNYFGRQRFGAVINPNPLATQVREAREPWRISVVQATIFNRFLSWRLSHLAAPHSGDLFQRSGAKRVFRAEADKELEDRLKCGEISVTGPMFGPKMMQPEHDYEHQFLQELDLTYDAFKHFGKKGRGTRRRLSVSTIVTAEPIDEQIMELRFSLPSGSYATTLLMHLFMPEVLNQPMDIWPNFTEPVALDEGSGPWLDFQQS